MDSQPLLIVVVLPMLDVSGGFGIVVVGHILASMHILIACGQEQAEPLVEESVSIAHGRIDIRHRTRGFDPQSIIAEIVSADFVASDVALYLIRRHPRQRACVE